MTEQRIRRSLEAGASVLVGSVDAFGQPACGRGFAVASPDDLKTLTVFIPKATSQDIMANIGATGRLAVVATHPIDHCSTQIKGLVTSTRVARRDEEAFVRSRAASFGGVLNSLGYPSRLTKAIIYWPAFAVEMRVEEIYEQTPGPNAGTRLR